MLDDEQRAELQSNFKAPKGYDLEHLYLLMETSVDRQVGPDGEARLADFTAELSSRHAVETFLMGWAMGRRGGWLQHWELAGRRSRPADTASNKGEQSGGEEEEGLMDVALRQFIAGPTPMVSLAETHAQTEHELLEAIRKQARSCSTADELARLVRSYNELPPVDVTGFE